MALKLTNNLLQLRAIEAGDEEILCQIYSSTRTEEMNRTDWSDEQKEMFLRSQFMAQHNYYHSNYEGANFWLILNEMEPIGRLYLHTKYEINSMRIIDISILPKWRNKGIGKQILLDVMTFAESLNRTITIHVESFNPAMRLYKTLGFKMVDITNGVYHLMEWKSKQQAA